MRIWPAVLIVLTATTVTPLLAQRPTSRVPRTAWGTPDLRGVWDFRSPTPMERPSELASKETFASLTEAEAWARQNFLKNSRDLDTSGRLVPYNDFWFDEGEKFRTLRTSLIVDPPNGRLPPLTPTAARKRAEERAARAGVEPDSPRPGHFYEDLTPEVRCFVGNNEGPPMFPSVNNNNVEIFQTRDTVVIYTEMIHDARVVPLTERPRLPEAVRQWLGDSRGRWDGQTLVVETRNFRDDNAPFGATAAATLIERFTRVSADQLEYAVTVTDAATWTQPWTYKLLMGKSDDLLFEYACAEGNYSLAGILAGARAQSSNAK